MTEQIKNAIQYGDDYYKDLISACCDISDRHKDYIKMANNSLKAWEEVIKELENFNENEYLKDEGHRFGCNEGICYAMELINQHLAEIEE